MKFPSASGGGTAPSGNSLAVTYPGVFGSRVGGVGRGAGAAACAGGVAAGGAAPTPCASAGWPAVKAAKMAMLRYWCVHDSHSWLDRLTAARSGNEMIAWDHG